jgi:hypothetical protein
MTLTAEQQAAIAAKVNGMTLPSGLGTKESACSIAAINLALTGRLTDKIPACMSKVIGHWIITVQDAMPDSMRNSKAWKSLLPLAAGTGKDRSPARLALIRDWVWTDVLPHIQQVADAGGFGDEWRALCEQRTPAAAVAAGAAAAVDAAEAAGVAWAVMEAEELTNAAEAVTKSAVVLAMTWASGAVVAAKASGDQEKAWRHFDPCGLLQKLVEVGNDIA